MPISIYPGPQHTPPPIDAVINNKEIVVFRKAMLVDQVTSSFLPVRADFITVLHETSECLFAFISFGADYGVVVFGDVEV